MITYMLDTRICSFIMREHPKAVIKRLAAEVEQGNRIVISAITYTEIRYGQIDKKALAKHKKLVDEFVKRVDAVLPWDQRAVDAACIGKSRLAYWPKLHCYCRACRGAWLHASNGQCA